MYDIRRRNGIRLNANVFDSDKKVPTEEIRQASMDVESRWLAWSMADPGFEEAAWYAFRAASERLNALLREAKEGVGA